MTKLSATDFAGHTFRRILDEFNEATGTTSRGVDRATVRSIRRMALEAITLLDQFNEWIPKDRRKKPKAQFRSALKATNRIQELNTLLQLMDDDRVSAHTGIEHLQDRVEYRIQRHCRELQALQPESTRADDSIDFARFIESVEWQGPDSEPDLLPWVQSSLREATDPIVTSTEPTTAHFTTVHEWYSQLEELSSRIAAYEALLDPNEWQPVATFIERLRENLETAIQCSFVKMRCTKWLEKSREPDESHALRDLANIASEEFERQHAEFVDDWNLQHSEKMQTLIARAMKYVSEPN